MRNTHFDVVAALPGIENFENILNNFFIYEIS